MFMLLKKTMEHIFTPGTGIIKITKDGNISHLVREDSFWKAEALINALIILEFTDDMSVIINGNAIKEMETKYIQLFFQQVQEEEEIESLEEEELVEEEKE